MGNFQAICHYLTIIIVVQIISKTILRWQENKYEDE